MTPSKANGLTMLRNIKLQKWGEKIALYFVIKTITFLERQNNNKSAGRFKGVLCSIVAKLAPPPRLDEARERERERWIFRTSCGAVTFKSSIHCAAMADSSTLSQRVPWHQTPREVTEGPYYTTCKREWAAHPARCYWLTWCPEGSSLIPRSRSRSLQK